MHLCTCLQPWTEAGARDRSEDLRDSVYAKRQDHAKEAQTFTRVLEHTQQIVRNRAWAAGLEDGSSDDGGHIYMQGWVLTTH